MTDHPRDDLPEMLRTEADLTGDAFAEWLDEEGDGSLDPEDLDPGDPIIVEFDTGMRHATVDNIEETGGDVLVTFTTAEGERHRLKGWMLAARHGPSLVDPRDARKMAKERIYVESPSDVPDGFDAQEGPRGGIYYETEGTSEGQARFDAPSDEPMVGQDPEDLLPEGRTITDDDLYQHGLDDDLPRIVEEGTEADFEAYMEIVDGHEVKSLDGKTFYRATEQETNEQKIVTYTGDEAWAKDAHQWVYNNVSDYEEYTGRDLAVEYEEEFWEHEDEVYHATDPETVAKIVASGELQRRNKTRGFGNSSVASAVFASTEGGDWQSIYGDALLEIDIEAMAEDGYEFGVEQEPGIHEARELELLAGEMHVEDFWADRPHDEDPSTAILYHDIPIEYISMDADEDAFETVAAEADRLLENGEIDDDRHTAIHTWLDKQRGETTEDEQTFFHGTTVDGANNLVENGINPDLLQSRDRGFFGKGFYVAAEEHTAETYGEEIVEVSLAEDADVADLTDLFEGVSMRPNGVPEWHDEFVAWYEGVLEEAAVWERISGVERADIMDGVADEMTPEHDEFDREDWYVNVARFFEERGTAAVKFADSEIVVTDPEQVESVDYAEGVEKSGLRIARVFVPQTLKPIQFDIPHPSDTKSAIVSEITGLLKERVYVDSEADAPDGIELHEGPRGGIYYEDEVSDTEDDGATQQTNENVFPDVDWSTRSEHGTLPETEQAKIRESIESRHGETVTNNLYSWMADWKSHRETNGGIQMAVAFARATGIDETNIKGYEKIDPEVVTDDHVAAAADIHEASKRWFTKTFGKSEQFNRGIKNGGDKMLAALFDEPEDETITMDGGEIDNWSWETDVPVEWARDRSDPDRFGAIARTSRSLDEVVWTIDGIAGDAVRHHDAAVTFVGSTEVDKRDISIETTGFDGGSFYPYRSLDEQETGAIEAFALQLHDSTTTIDFYMDDEQIAHLANLADDIAEHLSGESSHEGVPEKATSAAESLRRNL